MRRAVQPKPFTLRLAAIVFLFLAIEIPLPVLAQSKQDENKTSAPDAARKFSAEEQKLLDEVSQRRDAAITLRAAGKFSGAETEYRAMIAIRERVFGPDHPDTLQSRSSLAAVLEVQGKNPEAEQERMTVLVAFERTLGEENADTLLSRTCLALVQEAQGKYAAAELHRRTVLVMRERVLGATHYEVFRACFFLARCLEAQGKFSDAVPLLQRAEDGFQKAAGNESPDYQITRQVREHIEAAMKEQK